MKTQLKTNITIEKLCEGSEKEMDADHATAWSKGGATDKSNCIMLCKTHNRIKGNR